MRDEKIVGCWLYDTLRSRNMSIANHKYIRLRRTWIDVTSFASRRDGVLLYRPGRWYLRFVPKFLSILAVFPWPWRSRFSEILPRLEIPDAEFATIYIGNGTDKSKFTLRVKTCRGDNEIIKVARTYGGKMAINHEVEILKKLDGMNGQVPILLGVENQGDWLISRQSALQQGKSPVHLQKEHFVFLDSLKKLNISHGDFAPWNCSIVGDKLHVWDWEDAGPWEEGKDEGWFRKQVKELLGVAS